MKEFALIIVSVIIFLAVFEGVLPKGKFGKLVRSVMSLVAVLIILVPIINIFNSDYNFNSVLNTDSRFEEYLDEYKKSTLKSQITTILESENMVVLNVNVEFLEDKNKVEILLQNQELNENGEHIDIKEKAKTLIIERLYLSDWEIVVE